MQAYCLSILTMDDMNCQCKWFSKWLLWSSFKLTFSWFPYDIHLTLSVIYDQLSKDPNSLANLDQVRPGTAATYNSTDKTAACIHVAS